MFLPDISNKERIVIGLLVTGVLTLIFRLPHIYLAEALGIQRFGLVSFILIGGCFLFAVAAVGGFIVGRQFIAPLVTMYVLLFMWSVTVYSGVDPGNVPWWSVFWKELPFTLIRGAMLVMGAVAGQKLNRKYFSGITRET